MPSLYVIDGHAYAYQAFYAIKDLSAPDGTPTNAVFGFLNMLKKLEKQHNPDAIVVCFDCHAPTFRHEMFPEYKMTRKTMPEEMRGQIDLIKQILKAKGIAIVFKEGYEADDVMATIATKVIEQNSNWNVFLCTADKDVAQLINDKIFICNPKKNLIVNREEIHAKYNLDPEELQEYFALLGDSIDNIPGVKGIGSKKALELISKYHTIDNIYNHIQEIIPLKLRTILEEKKDKAYLSRKLFIIDKNVPIEVNINDYIEKAENKQELKQLYTQLGFQKLLSEMLDDNPIITPTFEVNCITTQEELRKIVSTIPTNESIYIDYKCHDCKQSIDSILEGLFFSWSTNAFYVQATSEFLLSNILSTLKPILSQGIPKRGHNLKKLYQLLQLQGILLAPLDFDTSLALYLCSSTEKKTTFDEMCLQYCTCHEPSKPVALDNTPETWCDYFSKRVTLMKQLTEKLQNELKEKNLDEILQQQELPMIPILAEMEISGILVNKNILQSMNKTVSQTLEELEQKIYKEAGSLFNISSPKQVGMVLFEQLKYPTGRKTKTGYSTSNEVLEKLATEYELPKLILEYRENSKLFTGYLEPLITYIHPKTKRIHSNFIQTGSTTGRITSEQPNLQNIPSHSEYAREIRKAFIAPKNWKIVRADYSQIELRILAHFSQDPNLLDAFRNDQDIHSSVAAHIFQIPIESITPQQRQQAKTVHFGILYGQTAFTLAKTLGISHAEAQDIINGYFREYTKVKEFYENTIEVLHRDKYITTLLGHRRFFPDVQSHNQTVRKATTGWI